MSPGLLHMNKKYPNESTSELFPHLRQYFFPVQRQQPQLQAATCLWPGSVFYWINNKENFINLTQQHLCHCVKNVSMNMTQWPLVFQSCTFSQQCPVYSLILCLSCTDHSFEAAHLIYSLKSYSMSLSPLRSMSHGSKHTQHRFSFDRWTLF